MPNTSTPKDTWQDQGMTILNTNPVFLDAAGEGIIWGNGNYRQVVQDANGVLIWDRQTVDPSYQLGADLSASSGSSMVGFLQAGVGASARNSQFKMRDIVSVMDFGAVGDGVTDDSGAILAAATYLSSIGGGTVQFPAPAVSYAMNPTYFNNLARVKFVGSGAKIIALQPGAAAQSPFSFVNCSDIEIAGLEIDGRYPYWLGFPPTTNVNNHNLFFNGCQRVDIHDCYLHDSGVNRAVTDKFGDGVYITGLTSQDISIHNNRFYNAGRWDIACIELVEGLSITDNNSTFSSAAPALGCYDIEMATANPATRNISITGNTSAGRTLIGLSGPEGFSNVVIANNNLSGYDLSGNQNTGLYASGISVQNGSDVLITGNVVEGYASTQGISLYTCNNYSVTNNIISSLKGPTLPPVGCFVSGSNSGLISGNTFSVNNAAGYGLQLKTPASDTTITSNILSNPLGWGASVSSDLLRFSNNVLAGATGQAMGLSSATTGAVVMGNTSAVAGRLGVGPHYVANNNMTINTVGGVWYTGGGTYINPDLSAGRSTLFLAAAPTAGAWRAGDIVKNAAPSVGNPKGWVCTVAGTPGTWVSEGNL